ncbi:Protein translocase subunit YajC [hydrothermal vent metagenome]|uniref:Protein translocase subunit YajC n=1 Tax=hydrothermal vent metagenome TaxID=652676 RepID=A0A3B1DJH2_9ZZZZ
MPTEQIANPLSQMFPLVIIFLIFYFLVIKPQKKQQKEQKNMRTTLKKNDQVVTSGGIHGTVVTVKDKTVMVRIDDNVKIEFDKESISTVVKKT